MNPCHQRRASPTSIDIRGSSSCCSVTPHCQSFSRTPQPVSVSAFVPVVTAPWPPKFRLLPVSAAHSPLRVRTSRLQSTTLSLSPSVQPRSYVLTDRFAGLLRVYALSLVAASR